MYLLMQYGDFGTLGDVSADGTFKRNDKIYQRVRGHVMTLKDYTIDSWEIEEAVAIHLFSQIVEGLNYLHTTLKIAHRDIKPENIVYSTEKGGGLLPDEAKDDPSSDVVKIGDFTVAIEVKSEGMRIRGREGTEAFLAPEIFTQDSYLPRPIDIWALGVTLYAYLFGKLPFMGKDKGDYTLDYPPHSGVSESLR